MLVDHPAVDRGPRRCKVLTCRREPTVRLLLLTFSFALSVPALGVGQIPSKPSETFSARAEAKAAGGVAATMLRIHVDRYTTDKERHVAVTSFETGGSAGLTAVLRMTPSTGYVDVDDRRWAIRYARQEPTPKGRQITVVLDQPMFFPGGELNPKSRQGFEVAVIQFEMDETGTGARNACGRGADPGRRAGRSRAHRLLGRADHAGDGDQGRFMTRVRPTCAQGSSAGRRSFSRSGRRASEPSIARNTRL
jgi:hypothetical protein